MSISELTSLQNTLNAAINAFKAELAVQNLPEPSLNTSKAHPLDDITFFPTPAMYEARRAALASLGLIKSLIQCPYDALSANTWMVFEVAGVRLTAEIGLATLLGDSEEGMSLADIAENTGVDGPKLERVIRLLISQGWFREAKPGYFANNRLSNLIKKDLPGYSLTTFTNDLFSKISTSFSDMINHPDPEFRKNIDPFHTAFQLALKTNDSCYGADGWFTKHPEESIKFRHGLLAVGPTSDPAVVADFPWEALAKGKDGIVDVGGGRGTLCCTLAARYPGIKKLIVQDLPESRGAAEAQIASHNLQGRVEFEAQDFFQPHQRKGKYLYVMQRILHDWSTEAGAKIIKHIKDVLHEDSCLLIIDTVIQPAVVSAEGTELEKGLQSMNKDVYQPVSPPPFVPTDFGDASRIYHQINVALTALYNAHERTLLELTEMVELDGMKITKVHATRGWASVIEVVPA